MQVEWYRRSAFRLGAGDPTAGGRQPAVVAVAA